MKIAILSKSKKLYSTRRLIEEAEKKQHEAFVINPLKCIIYNNGVSSKIFYNGKEIQDIDVVIPRVGLLELWFSISVVKQFEIMGIPVLNSSSGIALSKNKMLSLQTIVAEGIKIPNTIISRYPRHLDKVVKLTGGPPVIMKILHGTHGTGTILSESKKSVESILETIWSLGQDIMIQKFINQNQGVSDVRAFVIGDRVVASMKRIAKVGEFRSNIHRGAKAVEISLDKKFENIAVIATKALGLQIAGVDIIEDQGEPKVIEVNSSPGFRGLEKATNKNIAEKIIEFAVKFARAAKRAK